jgi:hypothetical protein
MAVLLLMSPGFQITLPGRFKGPCENPRVSIVERMVDMKSAALLFGLALVGIHRTE